EKQIRYHDLDLLGGYIYYRDKKYSDTVWCLTNFLKTIPKREKEFGKFSEALNTLGWAYYHLNDYPNAIKAFQRLAEFHKDDDIWAAPYDGMGWSYLKMGDKSTAKKMFEKALNLFPGYASSLAGLEELKKQQ
ncbi:MAG: tetratricopeptide repeat protein, partial [bacterium]